MTLAELFQKKGMLVSVDKAIDQLQKTAQQFGLKMGRRDKVYNSRLAQEVGLWAQSEGKGHAFHMAAFEAYFVKGNNLAQMDVLLELIEKTGLDVEEGRNVIETRSYSDAVDADWELSRIKRIRAVPTFFWGDRFKVGAQSYEMLERLVTTG